MFEKKDIDLAIAGALDDLEGFVHPMWGRGEKGTGIVYIPTNMIFFASGNLVGSGDGLSTKPEQYDGIVQVFADHCTSEQKNKSATVISAIIEENRKNETRQNKKRCFAYCDYDISNIWGAAMQALCKHFGVEFPAP